MLMIQWQASVIYINQPRRKTKLCLSLDEQKSFYKTFWSTRKYFSDPPTVLQAENFVELQKASKRKQPKIMCGSIELISVLQGGAIVFEKFEEIAKNDQVVSGAKSSQVAGLKRKSMAMDTGDEGMAEEILKEINNEYRFPRLLTNRKLLELEVKETDLSISDTHKHSNCFISY